MRHLGCSSTVRRAWEGACRREKWQLPLRTGWSPEHLLSMLWRDIFGLFTNVPLFPDFPLFDQLKYKTWELIPTLPPPHPLKKKLIVGHFHLLSNQGDPQHLVDCFRIQILRPRHVHFQIHHPLFRSDKKIQKFHAKWILLHLSKYRLTVIHISSSSLFSFSTIIKWFFSEPLLYATSWLF